MGLIREWIRAKRLKYTVINQTSDQLMNKIEAVGYEGMTLTELLQFQYMHKVMETFTQQLLRSGELVAQYEAQQEAVPEAGSSTPPGRGQYL